MTHPGVISAPGLGLSSLSLTIQALFPWPNSALKASDQTSARAWGSGALKPDTSGFRGLVWGSKCPSVCPSVLDTLRWPPMCDRHGLRKELLPRALTVQKALSWA